MKMADLGRALARLARLREDEELPFLWWSARSRVTLDTSGSDAQSQSWGVSGGFSRLRIHITCIVRWSESLFRLCGVSSRG